MGRGKLSLNLISNLKSRKATYLKRKAGVMKKASELSVLCGVDTCVIIYGTPDICDRPQEAEIWPPDHSEVERIIRRYQNVGIIERRRRTVGLSDFFRDKKRKMDRDVVKTRSKIWEDKYPVSDHLVAGFSQEQLRALAAVLETRIECAKKREAILKEEEGKAASATPASAPVGLNFETPDLRHLFNVQATSAFSGHIQSQEGPDIPGMPIPAPAVRVIAPLMDIGGIHPHRLLNVQGSAAFGNGSWPIPLQPRLDCTGEICTSSAFHQPTQTNHSAHSEGFVARVDPINWPGNLVDSPQLEMPPSPLHHSQCPEGPSHSLSLTEEADRGLIPFPPQSHSAAPNNQDQVQNCWDLNLEMDINLDLDLDLDFDFQSGLQTQPQPLNDFLSVFDHFI